MDEAEETALGQSHVDTLNNFEVVRYSNQRFRKHTYESYEQYRQAFDVARKCFLSVSLIDSRKKEAVIAYMNTDHGRADLGVLIGENLRGL